MSELEIEYQDRIPVFILSPAFKYSTEISKIRKYLKEGLTSNFEEIIIDLSNFFNVDQAILNRLAELATEFKNHVKKMVVIIPEDVPLEGLKIKLIDDTFDIYNSKYEAVYNLLN